MVSLPNDLALAKLSCEVRVQPLVTFYDQLIPIASKFEEHFPHWRTDGLSVRLLSAATRSAAVIRHNALVLEMDLPAGHGDAFASRVRDLAPIYLGSPHIKSVLRVGVRGHYFFTRGFTFEELVELFQERLYRVSPDKQPFLKGRLHDLMFNVVVERTDSLVHLIAGPVKRAELDQWTKPIEYDVGDRPEDIQYPEVAAFIDVDIYTHRTMPPKEAESFITAGIDSMSPIPRDLCKYLFEATP